jgi:hypothetical protein
MSLHRVTRKGVVLRLLGPALGHHLIHIARLLRALFLMMNDRYVHQWT